MTEYKSGYDLPPLPLDQFLEITKSMPDQEFIIEELLPKGQVMLVAGDPFQGKSLEQQRLACSFGNGAKYHGLKIKTCKAFYMTWEGATSGITFRLDTLKDVLAPELLPIIKMFPEPICIDTNEGAMKMLEIIQEQKHLHNIEVVLIDSFPYTCKKDYRKDEVVNIWWSNLQKIIHKTDVTPILVYELRKLISWGQSPEDSFNLDRLKGAKGIAYKCYSVLMIGEVKIQRRRKNNSNREWVSDGHRIHVCKAKDAKGSFQSLRVNLDRKKLLYKGNDWIWDEETQIYRASVT